MPDQNDQLSLFFGEPFQSLHTPSLDRPSIWLLSSSEAEFSRIRSALLAGPHRTFFIYVSSGADAIRRNDIVLLGHPSGGIEILVPAMVYGLHDSATVWKVLLQKLLRDAPLGHLRTTIADLGMIAFDGARSRHETREGFRSLIEQTIEQLRCQGVIENELLTANLASALAEHLDTGAHPSLRGLLALCAADAAAALARRGITSEYPRALSQYRSASLAFAQPRYNRLSRTISQRWQALALAEKQMVFSFDSGALEIPRRSKSPLSFSFRPCSALRLPVELPPSYCVAATLTGPSHRSAGVLPLDDIDLIKWFAGAKYDTIEFTCETAVVEQHYFASLTADSELATRLNLQGQTGRQSIESRRFSVAPLSYDLKMRPLVQMLNLGQTVTFSVEPPHGGLHDISFLIQEAGALPEHLSFVREFAA